MKKIILVMTFCAGSMMLFAQNRDYQRNTAPDAVRRSWEREYPNYRDNSTWDMQNNQWHTRYMDRDHNRNVDVYYDRYGHRVRMQSEWNRNDLPARVKDRLRRRYHYMNDDYNVYRIERPGRGFFFQITLGGNRKVYLDQYGREVRYY